MNNYIKTSGHYGGATDDCISTHGHACKPYFGADEALTASGHAAKKEMTPEEAVWQWIIYGGTMDAEGMPVRLIREVGSGLESDRTRTTNNLSGWRAAGAKSYKVQDKQTGETQTFTLQVIQHLRDYFFCLGAHQMGFYFKTGQLKIHTAAYEHFSYTPLPPKTGDEEEQEPEQQLPPPRG